MLNIFSTKISPAKAHTHTKITFIQMSSFAKVLSKLNGRARPCLYGKKTPFYSNELLIIIPIHLPNMQKLEMEPKKK